MSTKVLTKHVAYLFLVVLFIIGFCSCNRNCTGNYKELKECNDWEVKLLDECTGNWKDNWMLDGLIATVENSDLGMNFSAGPEHRNNAHHAVLWTKQSFKGDIKIEYDYTRTDSQLINVNILYIQAQGIGEGPYDKDIAKWNKLREVPEMGIYYNYMNPIHISYAAFPMENNDPTKDYIRVRKYPVTKDRTFHQMEAEPSYYNMGLFLPNITYKITVIKANKKLYMQVVGDGKNKLYEWDMSDKEPSIEGRVGLRHMFTRSARYKNFKVSVK
ncbi:MULTISPECIES: DUF1961 family protein [unclassified Saccharicrinis]|uniref:DUF1961 family protein n=1 Tax=unclassified Saccharicrinis TaxID=2646859 RepID=UPI003D3461B1